MTLLQAILQRTGVGKIRHLETKTLWVRQLVRQRLLDIRAIKGTENEADIGTKVLTADRLTYLQKALKYLPV